MSDLTEARIREIVREEIEAMVSESLVLSASNQNSCVGGAEVARQSHKLQVEGSNPSPATIIRGGDPW
jgi:hypothetical protein